uniref:Uncharacterized protein n=1 Tax=Arundo donax TaxID=35708 RepID=A0A0A9FCY9_ARUDO
MARGGRRMKRGGSRGG